MTHVEIDRSRTNPRRAASRAATACGSLLLALACVGLLASIHRRSVVIEHGALPFEKQRQYAVRL